MKVKKMVYYNLDKIKFFNKELCYISIIIAPVFNKVLYATYP